MVLGGIMVTFPEGTTVPKIVRRLVPAYKAWVGDRDETQLKVLHQKYLQYYRGNVDVLGYAIEAFCNEHVFEQLDDLLALKTKSDEHRARKHQCGEITIYAEGHPGWLLRMAMALDFGPHLKMRDSYAY